MKGIIIAVLCLAAVSFAACERQNKGSPDTVADPSENAVSEGLPQFDVTSTNLHSGVWDTVITNTENGNNVSPQLSWEPVESAKSYVIYMVDTSAGNRLHWSSGNITETSLP